MPNSLGYCGPEDRGLIQKELEGGRSGDEHVGTLRRFEAAYPFLKLIARNTGRQVFDYEVPEAYWIGNDLLGRVPPPDFYSFTHRELEGKDPGKIRELFRALDGAARPHHTFYVMSTLAASNAVDGPNLTNETGRTIAAAFDSCRVSWGRVLKVGEEELQVRFRPLEFEGGTLALAAPRAKRVRYNRGVRPFDFVRRGDVVSVHWGYACDVLSNRQARNIERYTTDDLVLINRYLASTRG